jgi:uncharacterized protein
MRMCVGCRQRRPAMEMIRFNALGDAVVVSWDSRKRSGRGCYVCPTVSCVDKALNKRMLQKALRRDIAVTPSREELLDERARKEGVIG